MLKWSCIPKIDQPLDSIPDVVSIIFCYSWNLQGVKMAEDVWTEQKHAVPWVFNNKGNNRTTSVFPFGLWTPRRDPPPHYTSTVSFKTVVLPVPHYAAGVIFLSLFTRFKCFRTEVEVQIIEMQKHLLKPLRGSLKAFSHHRIQANIVIFWNITQTSYRKTRLNQKKCKLLQRI